MNAIELKDVKKIYKIYKKPNLRIIDSLFGTKKYTEFHALKGISIEIESGEAVGVVGKNGAGKSTLLKILTGVTKPTEGTVTVNGKIAAILELNSGFDEELTGRDNIVLKCIILGYSRDEIEAKMNGIIDFADIGNYIDQPVRTYSSGMKARLGFAIAVNSDPDILIVDEALSVGDEVFKTKCLNKMSEFRQRGKTIFFVSHSIFTIKSFCTKAAWLKDGELMEYGDMNRVVQKYENFLKEEKVKVLKENPDKAVERKDYICVEEFKFNRQCNSYRYKDNIEYEIKYNVKKPIENLRWTFTVRDADDKEIYSSDKMSDEYLVDDSIGVHVLRVKLKNLNLLPGKYKLSGELRNGTGIMYVGYANKQEFKIEYDEINRGSGYCYIEHELI